MKGIQLFTDPTHTHTTREIFPAPPFSGAIHMTPSPEQKTGFLGFGVAITGASCYLLHTMPSDTRKSFLNSIYSSKSLALSVGRLSVGSSDYSAELYSYDDVPFDTNLSHFSIERDEAYIIPMIQEILAINPDLYLFASPWSPPAWMKTGNSLCGGYMRNEFVECYADYIIKFIKAYAAHGIKIRAITPQNEPNTQHNANMPCCIWHPETEAAFIKALHKKLQENHLSTKIWMFDHNFNDAEPRVLWSLTNCQGLADSCDGVAFHYYSGTIEQTACLQKAFPHIPLHFTEGGPRLYDHYVDDWCKWGIMAAKVLGQGYRSFTGWNLLLDETGGPNIGPFLCGGLATLNRQTGDLSYSGQYRALSHIAPYVTPASRIRPLYANFPCEGEMFSYPRHPKTPIGFVAENDLLPTVAVLINHNDKKAQVQLPLNNTLWYAELPPDSISTLIFEE